ncbi:MAG: 16S rRNA (guanine(966)-N(2))-methyltransferase RsmD [Nitrospiraceae bacterium]|nr:MAG: 16S rRNA (guanine(966)-N(2))-methyltransferase RsmD [Nitrospiraceae bacterium]
MRPGGKVSKSLRPTSGKVREALFNILRSRMENSRFLDLYAGTGAVGIEALRQGASEVLFVEAGRSNAVEIQKALSKYHFMDKTKIIAKKTLPFIEWAAINQMTFDIIFLDPPYHTEEIFEAMTALGTSDILSSDGIIVAEHFAKKALPDVFDALHKIRDYIYGDTVLSVYKKKRRGLINQTPAGINNCAYRI